jgi:hypothetical protein
MNQKSFMVHWKFLDVDLEHVVVWRTIGSQASILRSSAT